MNNWTYNESKHCGVDYADVKQAEIYDQQHQKFRNYEKEVTEFIRDLPMQNINDLSMIDLACGTGATSIYASRHFKQIYAIDVSDAMLNQAIRKAEREHITNIKFINAGFLSYEHKEEPVDIVLTKAALHHLPDFWKQIALIKMNQMLKIGGVLYIHDVIFDFEPSKYRPRMNKFISAYEAAAGKDFKVEVETHFRDEYSTFSWILEGMIARAGFNILKKSASQGGIVMEYFCEKIENVNFKENEV